MSKRVKDLTTNELSRRYGALDSLCVVGVSRMDAISANRLRGELRKQAIELHVVPNRLALRALGDGALGPLVRNLEGPCAFVHGETSVVDIAKELDRLAEEYPSLELKNGIVEGDEGLLPVKEIAKMKSRAEMLGEVVMLALSPARRVAGALTGPGGRVAGCVKAVGEREGEGASAAA